MRRTPARLMLFLLPALLTLVGGCQHIKTPVLAFTDDGDYLQPAVGEGLVASRESYIPDVPMPIGFRAVASQCTSGSDGRSRTVHHVYQGHAKSSAAAAFYQDVLPEHGWDFVSAQNVSDTATLTYTKGSESLTVETRHGYGVTTVTIDINAR
ncbi:hypothetical protein OT109_02450 [Phycisphaeraceae bacterium D3-23]